MSSLKITQKGGQRIALRLKKIKVGVQNPISLWNALGGDILKQTKSQFDSEGNTLGTPWTKLSNKTVIQKLRLGLNNGILQRTKQLKNSFLIKKKNRFELVVGSKVENEKFVWHQTGKGRMHRPVFNVNSPKFLSMLRRNIRNFLNKTLNG